MNNSSFPPTQPTPSSPSSSSLSAAAVSSSSPSSSSITVTKTATISSNVLPSSVVGESVKTSVTKSSNKLPVKKKCANDFKFIGLIGEGSFSMVALAVDINNKQKYAIKICEKRQLVKENKAKAIMTEKKILELLDLHSSPYLIRLHFSFQDSYRLFFGLSFARGGELLTYINKVSGFNEECTRFYSAQILLALEYLHKLGIIHRDLKPENLLLNERLHIQVTDFGSAFFGTIEAIKPDNCDFNQGKKLPSSRSKELIRNGGINNEQKSGDTEEEEDDREHGESFETIKTTVNDVNNVRNESERQQIINRHQENIDLHRRNGRSNSFVGTAQYVSPEMLRNKNSSTSSDLWAYGCIVYQMLVGNPPFNDATDFLIFQKILAVNLNFPEEKINPEWRDLIESLLILDQCKRLGASDDFTLGSYPSIRAHPFFTEFSQPTKVTPPSKMQKSPLFSSSTSTSSPPPTPPISSLSSTNTTTSVNKDTITVVSPRSPSPNCTRSGLLNQTTTSSSTQTRWSTLYLEESPLIRYLSDEDYLLESRISCLDYDDIEPGLHEGLLLGLGLSDNPKKSDLTMEKVDSTSSSSSSVTPSQRTGGNNSIPTTSNDTSGNNYNSKNDNSISSSQKENSRSNNPERVKKKGLFGLKWFKH